MRIHRFIVGVVVISALVSCTSASDSQDDNPKEVILMAYDAFTPEKGIFDDFTSSTGAQVKVVTAGDTGTMVSKAILTSGNPEADVMWGIDNTLLSRAQNADLLVSYEPVDEGDVCVNYDKKWFADQKLDVPTTLEELTQPAYKKLLAIQDPVASSPGLAFLLGTISLFGDNWKSYWKQLLENDVRISANWTTAYTEDFTIYGGTYPMVVSYGSSPPAEVFYSEKPISEPPTGVIESTCFRQTEYVGVMRGTNNPNIAQQLVNYLLAKKFQESIPLSLFVFPVNKNAQLPQLFRDFAVRPEKPLTMEPTVIDKNREQWLNEWRSLAL